MKKILLTLCLIALLIPSDARAQAIVKLCTQVAGVFSTSCTPVSSSTPMPVGVYGGASATSGYVYTSNGPGNLATFQAPSGNPALRTVGVTMNGAGSPPSTGVQGYFRVPFSGTITGYSIVSNVSGSAVVDIWKLNGAVPTVANTITASALPTLTSAQYVYSNTLTGWTTAVAAGDVFAFNLNSVSTLTFATVEVYITTN